MHFTLHYYVGMDYMITTDITERDICEEKFGGKCLAFDNDNGAQEEMGTKRCQKKKK